MPDRAHEPHRWGALTLFHGLPSAHVRAIAQDANGNLWFGTDAGLARYDGRRTQVVNIEEAAPSSVGALAFDKGNVLWVGTERGAWRGVAGAFQLVELTRGRSIKAITHADDGRTFIVCLDTIFETRMAGDGNLIVNEINSTPPLVAPTTVLTAGSTIAQDAHRLTSIAQDSSGNLFVGTSGRGMLSIIGGRAVEVAYRPRAYFVEAMERAAAAVWFGAQTSATGAGLYRVRAAAAAAAASSSGGGAANRIEQLAIPTGTIQALRADGAAGVWVGTAERGVFRVRADGQAEQWTFETTAGGLLSNKVNAVFVDREDVVWFGTDRGVCRYDRSAMRAETISSEASGNFVRVFYRRTNGAVLCGTNRGMFERTGATWTKFAELANETVHAFGEDAGGRLLIGTASGLFIERAAEVGAPRFVRFAAKETKQAKETKELRQAGEAANDDQRSVRAIALFRGHIYIGVFGGGVERIDQRGRRTPLRFAESDAGRDVVSLAAEGERRLWVGTAQSGVWRIEVQDEAKDESATNEKTDVEAAIVTREEALDALRGQAIWNMVAYKGALWLAASAGLYRFRGNEVRRVIADLDARGVIVADAANESSTTARVWLATNGGGLRLALVADDDVIVSRFDVEHGVPSSNVFAVMLEGDGSESSDEMRPALLAGTNRGAARFVPSHVAPLLRIVRIGNRSLADADAVPTSVRLAYPQNDLTLDFAALASRSFPEQFRYRFILRDARQIVITEKLAAEPRFVVEDLAPGRYVMEARVYSADLLASAPVRLGFEVAAAPLPLTTVLLSLLLVSAMLALCWGALQNRRIRRAGKRLAYANRDLAQARFALATEAEAERRRIARDLHDQTLADLRRLLLLADDAHGTHAEAVDPALLRREVESISVEVRRICEDLSPSVLENVGFAAALEWVLTSTLAELNGEKKVRYEFICDDDLDARLVLPRLTQIQLYRIVQEALSNICRHAAASEVRLAIGFALDENGSEDLIVSLDDDGRGFELPAAQQRRGRGLTNIHARANLIAARVAWTRRAPHGTRFTLRIAHTRTA